jgi:hypothetical protein
VGKGKDWKGQECRGQEGISASREIMLKLDALIVKVWTGTEGRGEERKGCWHQGRSRSTLVPYFSGVFGMESEWNVKDGIRMEGSGQDRKIAEGIGRDTFFR